MIVCVLLDVEAPWYPQTTGRQVVPASTFYPLQPSYAPSESCTACHPNISRQLSKDFIGELCIATLFPQNGVIFFFVLVCLYSRLALPAIKLRYLACTG